MADETTALLKDAATWAFADEMVDIEDMVKESAWIVTEYFRRNPFDGWGILHVEEEFVVEIDGFEVSFTPDLVVRDHADSVWIVDHKSTSSIPEGVPFASQQSLLYFAGVKAFYPEAAGFLFNYLRKKLPTKPRLNKTRNKDTGLYHVNNLNNIDTTFDVLFNFIQDEAPELIGQPDHMRRLAELRDGPERFFLSKRVLVNDHALETMVNETADVLEMMAFSAATDKWPRALREDRGWGSCSKCEFSSLCQAELLDFNTELVLKDYEPRDPKNPYETEDE